MVATRWLGLGILVGALCACGEDAKGRGGGDEQPEDGPLKACDAVSAEVVSDLLGVTLLAAPNDSDSVSDCFYEKKGIPTHGGLRIEYTGAQSFEQVRETITNMYEGVTTEVSGMGDAAFSHHFVHDFGDVASTEVILVATQGEALVGVTLGDVGLRAEAGVDMAKQIMALALEKLE